MNICEKDIYIYIYILDFTITMMHKSRLFIGVLDDDDTNQQGMIDRLFFQLRWCTSRGCS